MEWKRLNHQQKKEARDSYGLLALFLLILLGLACLAGTTPNLRTAKRVKAGNQINQINLACQSYFTEYDALPQTSENYRLMQILGGDNPRKIAFLSLSSKDVSPNGELIDPWGTPFRITFDADSKVHVISAGPDKIYGTPDDITNQ